MILNEVFFASFSILFFNFVFKCFSMSELDGHGDHEGYRPLRSMVFPCFPLHRIWSSCRTKQVSYCTVVPCWTEKSVEVLRQGDEVLRKALTWGNLLQLIILAGRSNLKQLSRLLVSISHLFCNFLRSNQYSKAKPKARLRCQSTTLQFWHVWALRYLACTGMSHVYIYIILYLHVTDKRFKEQWIANLLEVVVKLPSGNPQTSSSECSEFTHHLSDLPVSTHVDATNILSGNEFCVLFDLSIIYD